MKKKTNKEVKKNISKGPCTKNLFKNLNTDQDNNNDNELFFWKDYSQRVII